MIETYPSFVKSDEDKKQWDRLEDLLTWEDSLSHLEKQERLIHSFHKMKKPCWLCGAKQNAYEAAGTINLKGTADAVTHEPHDKYNCIACGVRMLHVVPFIASTPWLWGRPDDITKQELAAAAEKMP